MKKIFATLCLLAMTALTASAQFSGTVDNNHAYSVSGVRGAWSLNYQRSKMVSTTDAWQTENGQLEDQQFAFLKYLDDYYIYSPVASMFVSRTGDLSNEAFYPVYPAATGNDSYPWFFTFDATHNINLGGSKQMTIDSWSDMDDGNRFMLTQQSEFDPTDALAMLPVQADTVITINMANGTLTRTDGASSNYRNLWTSTGTDPQITLQSDKNNMFANAETIDLYSGSSQSSLYTLTCTGMYEIVAYSITGQAKKSDDQKVTTADGASFTYTTAAQETHLVRNLQGGTQTFTLAGSNTAIESTLQVYLKKVSSFPASAFTVHQGYETTGRGNDAVLNWIQLPQPAVDMTLDELTVNLPLSTVSAVTKVKAVLMNTNEYFAGEPLATVEADPASTVTLDLTQMNQTLAANGNYHLFVTATVADDAPLGAEIDAAVSSIKYHQGDAAASTDLTEVGDPEGIARIFNSQSMPFVPTTHSSKYFRIPGIIRAADNSLIAVSDLRYDSQGDLGNHKIDVLVRRSEDNGKTWEDVAKFEGDGMSADRYGLGDPALVRTGKGRLICLMAAGQKSFWDGIVHCFKSYSDDNGKTWSEPVDITAAGTFKDEVAGTDGVGIYSFFVTSGRGIADAEGNPMFLIPVTPTKGGGNNNYILRSTDEGETWTLQAPIVYSGGDEAKLALRKDGSILASSRQSGARGFNIGTADGQQWVGQWQSTTLSGNACNADILAYNDSIMLHTILVNTSTRKDLHLYYSTNQGETWHDGMTIQGNLAAYSCMDKLADGSVGIVFEDASMEATGNGYITSFVTITEEQILQMASIKDEQEGYGGYIKEEANPFLTTGVGEYFGLREDKVDEFKAAVEALSDDATINDFGSFRELLNSSLRYPERGYYRLQNNYYPGAYIGTTDGSVYGRTSNTNTDVSTVVRLEPNEDGTYNIALQGSYLQAPQQSTLITMGDEPVAFKAEVQAPGVVAFHTNYGYTAIHSADTRSYAIVGWAPSSEASKWKVEDAEFATVDLTQYGEQYYTTNYVPFPYEIDGDRVHAAVATLASDSTAAELAVFEGAVPQATPVVLYGDTAAVRLNIVNEDQPALTLDNELVGSYLMDYPYDAMTLNYSNDQVGFYYAWYIANNKAYLNLSLDNFLPITFTTGINGVNPSTVRNPHSAFYDLQGRRVTSPRHGVFIKDGKKVVIK